MDWFRWVEQTPPSMFVREDFYAYFVLLILHAWGMALLIGGGLAISLRVMGVAGGTRIARFAQFIPWMKAGAVLAVLSGIGLLLGYPAKALTNWIFALKFACLSGAALIVRHLARTWFGTEGPLPCRARWTGAAALALWLAGVACGKLLLYTNSVLLVSDG